MYAWDTTVLTDNRYTTDGKTTFIFIKIACRIIWFTRLLILTQDISVSSITAELSIYIYSHYYSFVPRFCLVHKCTNTGKRKYPFNSALCPWKRPEANTLKKNKSSSSHCIHWAFSTSLHYILFVSLCRLSTICLNTYFFHTFFLYFWQLQQWILWLGTAF